MDLTPLYDLRERLKTGAIAGTGLITEDFRLARALEGLAPFESASPVFARLGQSVRTLLAPDCADRAAALLDALALCDAVLVTQAQTATGTQPQPLGHPASGTVLTNLPYSTLSPLLEALTTSGSGRYSYVMDTHQQTPALFADYRVKVGMVAALGASYAELADTVADWLGAGDAAILPLLKQGFDPQGGKEMVRRVWVVEQIAGAEENDFYLSLLDDAAKDIRVAAILALWHDERNVERLMNLTTTEKGAAGKAAHRALARMQSAAVWEYWDKLFAKKPEQVAEYMITSTNPQAGELVGRELCNTLDKLRANQLVLDKDSQQRLQKLLFALSGKSGPSIERFYREGAALGKALDDCTDEKGKKITFCRGDSYYTNAARCFSVLLPKILSATLVADATGSLVALAGELYTAHGPSWLLPAVTAALLTADSATAYAVAAPQLHPKLALFGNKGGDKEALLCLSELLGKLCWRGEDSTPYLSMYYYDPASDRPVIHERQLAAPLDSSWYLDAVKQGGKFHDFLCKQHWPQDAKVRKELHGYFLVQCRSKNGASQYLPLLQQLGHTEYGALFRLYCESERIGNWQVEQYLDLMPVTNAVKLKELEWLLAQVDAGKIKTTGYRSQERLQELAEQLRQQCAAQQGG